jgi:hypothetical protein
VFIAITVLIIIVVLWLSSVRAEVHIKVQRASVGLSTLIDVGRTPTAGQLPGRVLQVSVEQRKDYTVQAPNTAGTITIGAPTTSSVPALPSSTSATATLPATTNATGIARGVVRIVNTYSKPQTLVKTTRLLTTDGKLYRIAARVSIATGGEAKVEVYADKPGEEFAIAPTKFTIPGLDVGLQKWIYAVSDEPFAIAPAASATVPATKPAATVPTTPPTGLVPAVKTLVSADDLDRAYHDVYNDAFEQAKRLLAADVGDVASYNATYFVNVEKKPSASVGQATATFNYDVKLNVTAVYYPKDDMLVFVRTKLKEKVPSDRELVPFDEKALVFQIESADPKTETASVRVSVNAEYRLTSGLAAFQKSAIAGKSKSDVITQLKTIDGVQSVDVVTHPGWLRKIPSLQDHIQVIVE